MTNIDLGTFSWDISAIEKQLIENRKQMEAFNSALQVNKKALKDEQKEIQAAGSSIAALRAIQKAAEQQLKEGTITQDEYNAAMANANSEITELENHTREIIKAQSSHIKTIMEQERAVKQLRTESGELNKLLEAGRTEITGNENAYRDLNKELNALKTEAKNIGATLALMRNEGKENTEEYRQLEEQFKHVSAEADKLNDSFKEIDKAVGDNQRSVGDYRDQIKGAFSDIWGGLSQMSSGDVKGGFAAITEGFSGIKDSAVSLFNFLKANPWLLIIGGIVGFTREVYQHNAAIREANKEVELLANTTGAATDELRRYATAISETYGRDRNEAVRELKSLMDDFNISSAEAFRIYNEGLAMGGAANSEFGDSIREYGGLIAQAGFSAQEFVNILNAGIDLGIYNDKLPDAIKEAGLSLTEQTKSTRDALINAFGASFTDDLLKRVQSGKTTVADALAEIAKEAGNANLNQQQLAQLTADIFRGAGEDAGGALVVFEAINVAQGEMTENMSELARQTVEMAQLNLELAEAKDEAFKSDAAIDFMYEVERIWKQIQVAWYETIGGIVKNTQKEIDFLKALFMSVRDTVTSIPKSFSMVLGGLMKDFNQIANVGRSLMDVLSNLTNPEAFTKALGSLQNQVKNFTSFTAQSLSDVSTMNKNFAKANAATVAEQRKAANEAAAARREAEKASGGNVTGSVSDAANKAASDAAKEAERRRKEAEKAMNEAAKNEMERLRREADIKADIARNELAEYIAVNAAKLDSDKRLTAERVAEQQRYFDEVRDLQLKNNTADLEKALLNKTEAEKAVIREQFRIREIEIKTETEQKKAEIEKNYANQTAEDLKLQKAIELEQRLLDMEAEGASEYEMRSEIAAQQRETDLAALEEQRANDLITYDNYKAQEKLINDSYAAAEKQIEKEKQDAKLDMYADALGSVSQLLGEGTAAGKAAAVAETTINTYKAATAAYAAGASLGGPLGAVMGPILAGIAVASGLANVKKIMTVKPKGYATGGLISGGVPISRSNGDNRLITAKDGEVILNESQQRALGGDRVFKLLGVPGFATGGRVGIPSSLPSVQTSISTAAFDIETMTIMMADAVAEGAAAGTYSGSQNGITDLSTNRAIANNANF